MVSSLAGSLALVTCKEPLRVSLSNQLRVLLQQVPQNGLDQAALEQTVQTIVIDNLEVRVSAAWQQAHVHGLLQLVHEVSVAINSHLQCACS